MKLQLKAQKQLLMGILSFLVVLVLAIRPPGLSILYWLIFVSGGLIYFTASIVDYVKTHQIWRSIDGLFGISFAVIGLSNLLSQSLRINFSYISIVTAGIALCLTLYSNLFLKTRQTDNRPKFITILIITFGILVSSFIIFVILYWAISSLFG